MAPPTSRMWIREACLTILAVAVTAGGYWGIRTLLPQRSATPAPAVHSGKPLVGEGERLEVAGGKLPSGRLALVIFSDPSCPFSLPSRAAHRRIAQKAAEAAVPVWLAAPEPGGGRRLASEIAIAETHLLSWNEISLRPGLVPVIALVDASGRVARVWRGVLDHAEEARLLDALAASGGSVAPFLAARPRQGFFSRAELIRLSRQRPIVFLVPVDRGEAAPLPAGVKAQWAHIPLSELAMRARRELPLSMESVIDCRPLGEEPCRVIAGILAEEGLVAHRFLDWNSCEKTTKMTVEIWSVFLPLRGVVPGLTLAALAAFSLMAVQEGDRAKAGGGISGVVVSEETGAPVRDLEPAAAVGQGRMEAANRRGACGRAHRGRQDESRAGRAGAGTMSAWLRLPGAQIPAAHAWRHGHPAWRREVPAQGNN